MPFRDEQPILYYDPCANDQVIAVEHLLPCSSIEDAVKSGLDPWILQFVGVPDIAAHAALEKHWNDINDSCLISLRDHLLAYTPRSIVLSQNQEWLAITDTNLSNARRLTGRAGDNWYVAPPPRIESLQKQLDTFGLAEIDCLTSFLLHFDGLREDLPGLAGNFFKPEEWQPFASIGSHIQRCRGYHDWQKAIMFYYARNGDHVLLDPSGKLGWFVFAENKITHFVNNSPAFVTYFVEYIKHRYPLDSYGYYD